MVTQLLAKIFGTRNQRLLKRMSKVFSKINDLEQSLKNLSDVELGAKTAAFREQLKAGESLDSILPEAFAVVREASWRVLGMRHFDVQLIGGMAMHSGKIAEMGTGEGKTLMATLAAYLNALPGKGVHVVTVNEYLVKRDAAWMGQVYQFLGLTVGVNVPGMTAEEKREAYAADITYGTNNEFGFDYLRDNMAIAVDDRAQRELHYAIVDEVDSILIDEARTPLIISGPAESGAEMYQKIHHLLLPLQRQMDDSAEAEETGDFTVDEKTKQVFLTEQGQEHVEQILGKAGILQAGKALFDAANISLMYHVNAALRAQHVYQCDVDYVVKNNEILIVDEHTGRLMVGRRWSDGLHQAMEAKEGVKVNEENQTLASITFQNYFRQYQKLSGMTGTADTEAGEFHEIYALEVVIIPTNKPMQRLDGVDKIYLSAAAKYDAIVAEIKQRQAKGQPILVGTASIQASEMLSKLLKDAGVKHEVLNAKQHEREAKIIAQAGQPAHVTIATNMAGRGTDIVLGGNLEAEFAEHKDLDDAKKTSLKAAWQQRHDDVLASGGLHVLGTERHESRRIDNQLRGRSGRQGDPGSSQFYLSLEDNLMRIFASERAGSMMQRFGMQDHEAIEHRMVNKIVENAQRRVEAYNFDVRKQLLQFDDVANAQRQEIYAYRNEYMEAEELSDTVAVMVEDVAQQTVQANVPAGSMVESWDLDMVQSELQAIYGIDLPLQAWVDGDHNLDAMALEDRVMEEAQAAFGKQRASLGDQAAAIEKSLLLQCLDHHWKDHLQAMDHLRQGINLRGYAQKNPIQEFKREALSLFMDMLDSLKRDIITMLMHLVVTEQSSDELEAQRRQANVVPMDFNHVQQGSVLDGVPTDGGSAAASAADAEAVQPMRREGPKVGRNDPCPCDSGKKYKQCHGRIA